MHIYDQCNFSATILPSTCVVISDLLSVSCATVARKNLIGWCKQRDFLSRRLGARFMSISKPFYQHNRTIYRRSKSYLIVMISSDTAAENYGQVWLQFALTTRVLPLRPLAMLWHARGPEAATLDSWPAPQDQSSVVETVSIDILNFGHHLSTIIHCSGRPRQWYTVKSNNKPSHVVMLNCHCQIIDILLHELWVVKYLATFERWFFGVHYLHLKNVGF